MTGKAVNSRAWFGMVGCCGHDCTETARDTSNKSDDFAMLRKKERKEKRLFQSNYRIRRNNEPEANEREPNQSTHVTESRDGKAK